MYTKSIKRLGSLLPLAILLACGGSHDKTTDPETTDNASISTAGAVSAMQQLADQAEEIEKKGPVATIDFRRLKELLPAEADGLPRKEASGEKNGAAGFSFSTAVGKYGNADDSETIEITLVDGGGSSMMMGLAAWSMLEIDKETADGYEKTGIMGNYKSYEKYNSQDKNGEIALLVAKRYVVTAKGRGIDMDKLKEALNDVDLDKLAGLE